MNKFVSIEIPSRRRKFAFDLTTIKKFWINPCNPQGTSALRLDIGEESSFEVVGTDDEISEAFDKIFNASQELFKFTDSIDLLMRGKNKTLSDINKMLLEN